jgi:hypothetical protein
MISTTTTATTTLMMIAITAVNIAAGSAPTLIIERLAMCI